MAHRRHYIGQEAWQSIFSGTEAARSYAPHEAFRAPLSRDPSFDGMIEYGSGPVPPRGSSRSSNTQTLRDFERQRKYGSRSTYRHEPRQRAPSIDISRDATSSRRKSLVTPITERLIGGAIGYAAEKTFGGILNLASEFTSSKHDTHNSRPPRKSGSSRRTHPTYDVEPSTHSHRSSAYSRGRSIYDHSLYGHARPRDESASYGWRYPRGY